jgi:DNA-binding CsgD family transcriptional regulator
VSSLISESGFPGERPGATQRLESRDITGLLHLMAELACLRNDPRRWRIEALTALMRMLPATAAAAFVLRVPIEDAEAPPAVISIFDLGFKKAGEHQAFLDEFNESPFQDPLSRRALAAARSSDRRTITVLRHELIDDGEWYSSPSVERYRRAAHIDDCVMSIHRAGAPGPAAEPGQIMMVLAAFRGWNDPARFAGRDRLLMDSLHQGLEWLFRVEEKLQRVTRATALPPRLRQTLDFLLAGDTERQVAARMAISIHTVHDYVKALYAHFGVSSRGELMARWIQSGEVLPANRNADPKARSGQTPV